MKKKLAIFNAALCLYLAGLLAAIGVSFGVGAILVLVAGAIIFFLYASQLYKAFRNNAFWSLNVLGHTLGLLVVAWLFVQSYSIAIGRSLFGLPGFYELHVFIGFILLALFIGYSIAHVKDVDSEDNRYILLIVIAVSSIIGLVGYLGFARILPGTVKWIYYAYVFLTFAYFFYFLYARFANAQIHQKQLRIAFGLSSLMILFWIVRWQIPNAVPSGLYRVVFDMGFVLLIVLPSAIRWLRKYYFLIVFLLYTTLVDFYFIGFSKDFKYFSDVGISGCVGYENALDYPINQYPGLPIAELLKPPTSDEILAVREEWIRKDFTPKKIRLEYVEQNINGDSIKVISHSVNGFTHYGLIRIPAGLDTKSAPILLALNGGGSGADVLGTDLLYRIAGASCWDVLNNYIVIAPSFRGDLVRGDKFCFRSEGYTGDVWAGPAEDAVFFLEAVKELYNKDQDLPVLAMGISRGATVALILGGLTNKITHIIAISTHTDFLNEDVFRNERVGGDFPRIFFTPDDTSENIRKKILTSSPLYFAEYIPSFEIHQGTADHLTTLRHARALELRLKELKLDNNARFSFYEGKGHGFCDDKLVCSSLAEFFSSFK